MKVWRIRAGEDRRFRAGHPWVYSNELLESPSGLEPGVPVELRDAAGDFLARGYGNPHSLIAFRELGRDITEKEPLGAEGIFNRLSEALHLRTSLGLTGLSHRLCYGEADRLPGLIIDRYRVVVAGNREAHSEDQPHDVFVIQAHTAGMDKVFSLVVESLVRLFGQEAAIIARNDISVRKLEGLTDEPAKVIRPCGPKVIELDDVKIKVPAMAAGNSLEFSVDLVNGQKTGFFLDQAANIALAGQLLKGWQPIDGLRPVRILDLCCYVGQWGAQLAQFFKTRGLRTQVTAVDASADALKFAGRNIERAGGEGFESVRGDALKDLAALPDKQFDIVIADPPALIQGRKNIPVGKHAYLQLNTQALRLVRDGGVVVSCSCSYLMDEDAFLEILQKAQKRSNRRVLWIGRGTQAADHPVAAAFPEGRYLKCWVGSIVK